MSYRDIRQPEKVYDGGETDRIALSYVNRYQTVQGEHLQVDWAGTLRLPEKGKVLIQNASIGTVVKINGQIVELKDRFTEVLLEKGLHPVAVSYTPKWHAGSMLVNFFPESSRPRAPESLAEDVKARPSDIILFAQLQPDLPPNNEHGLPDFNCNTSVATLPVLPHKNGQILILNSRELLNVQIVPEKGADIRAVLAGSDIGTVSGTQAPVYRFAASIDSELAPQNCRCTGGAELHCSTNGDGAYPQIQALSRALFGRHPDFYHSAKGWQAAAETERLYRKLMDGYKTAQAKCGGNQALRFDNAVSGSTDNTKSWFDHIGGAVPEQGFNAYYFTHDAIGKPFATEHVSHCHQLSLQRIQGCKR